MEERKVDVAIIGSGTAGLNAMGRVKRAEKDFVLINGGEPGTTCARVGCMPSKAIIQVAEDFHRRSLFVREGIEGGEQLKMDIPEALEHTRDLRDNFVDRVLSNSTDHLSEDVFIQQYARFVEPGVVELEDGQRIRAEKFVIATGSTPIVPEAWKAFGDRIVTTDEFFELEDLPASMAVIGLGVIGLELGQAIARLGVKVTGIDLSENIGGITDPEVNKAAIEVIGKEFPLWLGQGAEITEEPDGRLRVTAGENSVVVDKIFASLGRRPNLDRLGLDKLGIALDERGIPAYNPNTMQIGDHPLFLAGDVNADRPILHEAGDEGKIAGYNAGHDEIRAFQRKTPLAIVFSDPNIISVGSRFADLEADSFKVGEMKIAPVGRALIMGKNRGTIRVYADKQSGRLLGAEMVAPRGENLAHLLAWCIQKEMTVGELIQMPFYHPVMEEALQAALTSLYHQVEAKNAGPIAELISID
ncbi:dihydrolipoyl dehydrogenase [Thiolapillus brandeum]|uniref:Dihydrolipoamide dehydrogenase n=1 Tax=Thiolapillus brandeum TaxID=1076588 RepID=A0A7U6GIL5_9GAMM|nr:dihydrolipoyl dehydrogenase [Thiolapillus brandeum]BAO44343.1 dihydrolipoamide dehydrogenase [Thiolapillus brandeum]